MRMLHRALRAALTSAALFGALFVAAGPVWAHNVTVPQITVSMAPMAPGATMAPGETMAGTTSTSVAPAATMAPGMIMGPGERMDGNPTPGEGDTGRGHVRAVLLSGFGVVTVALMTTAALLRRSGKRAAAVAGLLARGEH